MNKRLRKLEKQLELIDDASEEPEEKEFTEVVASRWVGLSIFKKKNRHDRFEDYLYILSYS